MTTTVQYHADGYGPARPAINVKLYCAGIDMRSADVDAAMPEQTDDIHETAYQRVVSDFWQAAQEIATERGLGEITQEGRSGGWLVFEDAPEDLDIDEARADDEISIGLEARAWIKSYAAFADWAEDYIAAAPRRISRLAQDYAMDELGARAVTLRLLSWPGYHPAAQSYELTRKDR